MPLGADQSVSSQAGPVRQKRKENKSFESESVVALLAPLALTLGLAPPLSSCVSKARPKNLKRTFARVRKEVC